MAGPPAYLKTAWPRRPSASSRGDRDANQRCDRHCSPRSLPAPLSRALPLPQSDFTTPEKCKRVLDDLGEKYDPQATHQELKIQAAVANKRQRGQRLNFGETVTATEAARLQSVQSLLKIKDKVGQNFERNNPAVTIKCLIGEVRLPPPPLPLPAPRNWHPTGRATARAACAPRPAHRTCPSPACPPSHARFLLLLTVPNAAPCFPLHR